jgi:predicted CopG family antitoxin
MATKTISIDTEAYEALRRRKRRGQSFSDVIKEHFGGSATAATLLAAVQGLKVDESTLEALEGLIEGRSLSPARAPEL